MKIHDLKLSNGFKNFNGKLIIGEKTLYFLCYSKGNAVLKTVGLMQGGTLGGLMLAISDSGGYGTLDAQITEAEVRQATKEIPHSVIFEAKDIEKIQHNIFLRFIKWDGKKMGAPSGFSKALRNDLRPWTLKHHVRTSGI